MATLDISQLELLAHVDELVERLSRWAEPSSAWEPMNRSRALVRRLLSRIEKLRIRLEAPLVLATFGGTGTGKSSLVNALVGQECTSTGRERPTTSRPVLVAHPETELEVLGLPSEDFEIVRVDAAILRDMVIIDCPDPDTSEAETTGSHLQLLHQLLPHCDVLIYTSTQQKYRSARVSEELGLAATGCRLLFVQTHASVDDDIRDDWRKRLAGQYEVPETFFVDSIQALKEQSAQQRPSGDFAQLQDLITTQLAASERVHIRRANLLDLLHAALSRCRTLLQDGQDEVETLQTILEQQRNKLTEAMSVQLRDELLSSRALWERRLLESVTQNWGFSPFSSVLRFYNGIGNLIASMSFYRARNSAQMALIGALQGARWLKSRKQQRDAESQVERLAVFGLDDDVLRESQFIVRGYVQSARLDPELVECESLEKLRHEAARVEDQFFDEAGRKIDGIIDDLAARNSRMIVRAWYELLLALYLGFVLFRIGKNFFYDTFLKQFLDDTAAAGAAVLSVDFYIPAAVFFLLWSGILVMTFTSRLRRGLHKRIESLAAELAEGRIASGLFPRLDQTCKELELRRAQLESIAESVSQLRQQLAASPKLGAPIASADRPSSVGESAR